MRRLIHTLVLFLVSFHTGCFANPVSDNAKNHVWIYAYTGEIETTTTACNKSLARWSISGNLSLYYHEGYMIAKLDNVKTSLFNGPRSNLENVQEKEIPEESKAILQPFVIKKAEDKSFRILLKPNEPLWSVNMKKAMVSSLNFELDILANEKSELKSNDEIIKRVEEHSIYGKCTGDITMEKIEPDSDVHMTVYRRNMIYLNCTKIPLDQEINTLKPLGSVNMYEFLDFKSNNVLVMKENQEAMWKGSSETNISYKLMHSSPYSLNAVQRQTFTLQESVEVKESLDISELTEERNLIYEFGDEPTLGRHIYETDQSVLVKNYLENYDLFEKQFKNTTLDNYDIQKSDPVDKMFLILMTIDNQGLKSIEKAVRERNDFDFSSFHYALLPYIGTNATVKYLSKFLQTVPNFGNSAPLLKAFATFPRNIRYPTDDILENLEPFMDLKNMEQQTVKSAAVLSFASAIGRACSKDTISKKYITKYVDMFNSKYLGGENSEERMTHLLGLVNMAECLDVDFMNGIITNTSESSYLRTLAIAGFKPTLSITRPSRPVFDIYWPIIQKKSEPFDVRVAALDLLLVAYPSRANLDLIVERYSKHLKDPEDKQLANYLLTSLHSRQNSNWYINNYMGAKATAFVKNNQIPPYPKAWATGNYRLSYTDNDYDVGAYFDTRLITDPKTNIINTIQLTFNHFASSFDFGTYNLYLKIDGLANWSYALKYINSIQASSVPELLKLLKDNKFEFKGLSKDFRCDIVLFVDHVAVYAKHFNGDQFEMNKKSIVEELDNIVSTPKYISYPIMDYTHMPSALGTPILITNYLRDISVYEYTDKYITDRSSWNFQTWIEAYNPLVDANIASYKYYVNEKNLNITYSVKLKGTPTFTWKIKDDTYSQFWDNMMGTAVEEEKVLKQYCQDCKPFNELPTDIYGGFTTIFEPFGFDISVNKHSHKENPYTTISEFYHGKIHQPNVDGFPYAAPVLLLAHMGSRKFWLESELQRGSYKSYPLSETTSQTNFTINVGGNLRNRFRMENHMDIHIELKTQDLEEKRIANYVNMTYAFTWTTNNNDTEGNRNSALYETLNFKYVSDRHRYSFKVCGNRESFFPGLRGDKLSLEPFEAATGKTILISAKNIEDDEDCIPDRVYTLKEVYSASDKEKILENKYLNKDYNKCVSDSKDLKFTAPTAECKRVSSRLTEYDNYKVYLKSVKYLEDGNNETNDIKQPFFECIRADDDKLKLSLLKLPWTPEDSEDAYYKYTMYYPKKTVDPNWLAYNEYDDVFPKDATSTCTVAPSEIELFSGKYISNSEKEWLAFAECYNVSTRGLIGHTIGDKNVGFTFYSDEHVVTATVKDGKAEIKINGTVQNEFNDPFEHFRVHHLDDNVFHVRDEKVDIYYNTEYISVKVPSLYSNLLCGVCTQEH